MTALVAALLLAAQPYPAPRLAPVTDRTKSDAGVVVSVDAARGELKVKAAAGIVTFKAGGDVQVFDTGGKPIGAAGSLAPGQKVRVWYVVDGAARAVEIALE
jgi:anti-sigma-K factor RskA